jgi:hypothetical protein
MRTLCIAHIIGINGSVEVRSSFVYLFVYHTGGWPISKAEPCIVNEAIKSETKTGVADGGT